MKTISSLQIELSCKLIQKKLLHRDVSKTVSLLEVSLAGSVSMDVIEASGRVKKFALAIRNPCFSVSDGKIYLWPATSIFLIL